MIFKFYFKRKLVLVDVGSFFFNDHKKKLKRIPKRIQIWLYIYICWLTTCDDSDDDDGDDNSDDDDDNDYDDNDDDDDDDDNYRWS